MGAWQKLEIKPTETLLAPLSYPMAQNSGKLKNKLFHVGGRVGWLEKLEIKPTQPCLAGAWLSLAIFPISEYIKQNI